MGITAVSHLAIGVREIETSLRFYRDFLGLRVTADWVQEFTDFTNQTEVRRRTVWMRWGEGPRDSAIVLDQLIQPESKDARAELYDLGVHHFSFWVDDIDAFLGNAEQYGVSLLFPHTADTSDYGEPAGGKIRSVFMRDPDGNFVQLDQRA